MTIIYKIISLLITLSVVSVFIAVFLDFEIYRDKRNVNKSKRSIVATGSMTAFFVVYYLILRSGIGYINYKNFVLNLIGTIMVVSGAVFNIIGRINLNKNWANHIKIYDNHKLITNGMYSIVRHPLYASIILMLIGGSLVYSNWLCGVLTAFLFVPFMYYRAKQEEELLITVFTEYNKYKEKIGMFFPKLWG